MKSKGMTHWFPRNVYPARHGVYECGVQISRSLPHFLWRLEWDGIGFKVPFPMIVLQWRGLTKSACAALEATQEQK